MPSVADRQGISHCLESVSLCAAAEASYDDDMLAA